jgi:hypothetical protein
MKMSKALIFISDTLMTAIGLTLIKFGNLEKWQTSILFIAIVMYFLLRMKNEIEWCIEFFKECRKKKIEQYYR